MQRVTLASGGFGTKALRPYEVGPIVTPKEDVYPEHEHSRSSGSMCLLCAAKLYPARTCAIGVVAFLAIDFKMLCWLGMFAVSMSFMDHRRDHEKKGRADAKRSGSATL